jgi:hypothetical protein
VFTVLRRRSIPPVRTGGMIETAAEARYMNRNIIRFFTAIIILIASALPLAASASTAAPPNLDNWVGTWILNVQKSQYGADRPPIDPSIFKQILKIRVSNGTLDVYVRTEMADGTDLADETHLLDLTGKPHVTEFGGFKPVTETFKQVDQNTIEIMIKARPDESSEAAPGELTIRVRLMMSADRNTLRETKEYRFTGSDEPNPAEGSVLVFDRQPSNR